MALRDWMKEKGGQWRGVQKALESRVEEAGVAEIVKARSVLANMTGGSGSRMSGR